MPNDKGNAEPKTDESKKTHRVALRRLYLVLAGFFCLGVIFEIWYGVGNQWFTGFDDYDHCMGVAQRWLADGSYFLPVQLAGPHTWHWGEVLYPPVALWLFVPFSFLPMAAWFATPLTIILAGIWRLRPAPWALAVMALLLWEPVALVECISGNPLLWFMAIEFAAMAWSLPMSLGLFKPSLFPFALFGIRTRRWWLGVGLLALLSLPFLQLSFTWVRVILDTHGRGGLLYNGDELAYALIPYIAWLGSDRFDAGSLTHARRSLQRLFASRHRPSPGAEPGGSSGRTSPS